MCFGPDGTLVASFLAAILFVGLRALTINALPMTVGAKTKFELKSSWLTNTTLLGAVLANALKDLAAPKDLVALSLLFAATAAIALLVAVAMVRDQGTGWQTPLWSYLLSAVIALWAGIGQLLTLICIVSDAPPRQTLTPSGTAVFFYLLLGALAALGVYVWRSMGDHLRRPPAAEWPFL